MPRCFTVFAFATVVSTTLMGCGSKEQQATSTEREDDPAKVSGSQDKSKSVEQEEDEPNTDSAKNDDQDDPKPAKDAKDTDAEVKGDATKAPSGPSIAETLRAMDKEDAAPDRSDDLRGSDQNGDGLRDDIEAYIDALDNTDEQKQALRQHALALSKAVVLGAEGDSSDGELRAATRKIGDASSCLYSVYGVSDASSLAGELEKRVANTKERFQAYDKFNGEVSGLVLKLPVGDTCNEGQ